MTELGQIRSTDTCLPHVWPGTFRTDRGGPVSTCPPVLFVLPRNGEVSFPRWWQQRGGTRIRLGPCRRACVSVPREPRCDRGVSVSGVRQARTGQLPPPLDRSRANFAPAGRSHPIPDDVDVSEVTAVGVPCHWLSPPEGESDRVLLFVHGGGFSLGSVRSHGELAAPLGRAGCECCSRRAGWRPSILCGLYGTPAITAGVAVVRRPEGASAAAGAGRHGRTAVQRCRAPCGGGHGRGCRRHAAGREGAAACVPAHARHPRGRRSNRSASSSVPAYLDAPTP